MPAYRNVSADTVQDFVTGQVAEPDALIEIPDSLSEFYAGHPVFQEDGAYVPPTAQATADTHVADNTGSES